MRAILMIVFCAFHFLQTPAQTASSVFGAHAAAMGNCSMVNTDGTSLMNNVGSMARLQQAGSFFSYEIHPALTGANRIAAAVYGNMGQGFGGIGAFRFGDSFYNEQSVFLGYGHEIGITSLGVSLTYFQNHAQGFEPSTAWAINFGGLTRITPHITIGALLTNMTQQQMGDRMLPTRLAAGLAVRPHESFMLVTEIDKDLAYHAIWRMGAEYSIQKKVYFRTGFTYQPAVAAFGLGLVIRKLTLDHSLTISHELGNGIQASATYRFKSLKK